jgi:PhnB protein
MKQIVPEIYILDCKNALAFYKNTFGGVIKNIQISDDNALFQNIKNKVIHSELHVNPDCIFYFADIFNPKRARAGNVTLMLHMESKKEIDYAFNVLKEDGHIGMPLQKTLTGSYHAIVTDKYGAPWSLNYAKH